MLGLPKEKILGRTLSEMTPLSSAPELLEVQRSVARGRVIKDHLLEGEAPANSGKRRTWRVNASPIFGEDGVIRAISTASIELTNKKKVESALIQSERLAAVGPLASSISHKINSPLEAITNLLYLIALS